MSGNSIGLGEEIKIFVKTVAFTQAYLPLIVTDNFYKNPPQNLILLARCMLAANPSDQGPYS